MGIVENAKELAGLIKKIDDIDLYRRIVELEGEIIDLTHTNRKLESEKQNLEEMLNQKKKMTFKKPFYYAESDPHPFCQKCWEVSHSMVHLDGPTSSASSNPRYECHSCKAVYFDRARAHS